MHKRFLFLILILTVVLTACEKITIKNTYYYMLVQVYGDTLIFSGDDEQRNITVESDARWHVNVESGDWLAADSIAVNQFQLRADSNLPGQPRYATVTVTNDSSEHRSFVVYQQIHVPDPPATQTIMNMQPRVLTQNKDHAAQ